jgi:SAM-dependent methyltransferase
VLDVPCGPGRIYHYWSRRGFDVTGMDMSEPMVGAAAATRAKLGIAGSDSVGDAFGFEGSPPKADLVASVRFVYYFEPEKRIALMRSLGAAARKYVLIQYKTSATYKGSRNAAKLARKKGKRSKHFPMPRRQPGWLLDSILRRPSFTGKAIFPRLPN